MDTKCAKFVSHYGTTWGNQIQWLVLNGMFGGNLGFIKIYQPSKIDVECGNIWLQSLLHIINELFVNILIW
jgi:hypothetical protein